jgi:hypothetical protein
MVKRDPHAPVIDEVVALHESLRTRDEQARAFEAYYRGAHPQPWAHAKASTKYRKLLDQAVSNFPLLIVDSVLDRLEVTGFRLEDDNADDRVWELWQGNNMDVAAPQVMQQALVTAYSYVSVWPNDKPAAKVPSRIRAESMHECYHEVDPDDPTRVRRALKVWSNRFDKRWHAVFVADDVIYQLEGEWAERAPAPTKWRVTQVGDNPFGVDSPFVPMVNRPTIAGLGLSELADVVPIFDRINTLTGQLLLAGELAAFKVRWATGIDIPQDDEGKDVEPFDVAMDRLWISENEAARFGTFDGTDLDPYANAIDQAIQQAAAISRTPPFLLLGKLTNLSAEALKATESGLVNKVQQRMRAFSDPWEKVINLALLAAKDERAGSVSAETLWRDPENVSEAQRVDALSKLYNIGLPTKAVWEKWGATPQEIDRWEAMAAEDTMRRLMLESAQRPPGLDGAAASGQPAAEATPLESTPLESRP